MAAFPSRRSVLSVSRLPTIGKREKLFEWTTTAFPSRRRHGGGLLGVMYDRINEKDRNARGAFLELFQKSARNCFEKGEGGGKGSVSKMGLADFSIFSPSMGMESCMSALESKERRESARWRDLSRHSFVIRFFCDCY